jgi:hypothetical protein
MSEANVVNKLFSDVLAFFDFEVERARRLAPTDWDALRLHCSPRQMCMLVDRAEVELESEMNSSGLIGKSGDNWLVYCPELAEIEPIACGETEEQAIDRWCERYEFSRS